MNIGLALKQLRLEKGLGQMEVSKLAKVAQGKISNIERGKYPGVNLSEYALRPILEAIGVTYVDLIAKAQEGEQLEIKVDKLEAMLAEIHEAVFSGNGEVQECRFVMPKGSTDVIPLAVEFDPVLSVKMREPLGSVKKGDVLIFTQYDGGQIEPDGIYVTETKAKQPFSFLGKDYDGKQHPVIKGKAVQVMSLI